VKKIPTLFVRDPDGRRFVLNEVTPGCEWVLAGEGVATRKYDGTCGLIRRDGLAVKGFARREVKPGKEPPPNWFEVDHDETTGKRVGWEPIGQSSFVKFFEEAVRNMAEAGEPLVPGTYELIGPKINGNSDEWDMHWLVEHATAVALPNCPTDFDELRETLHSLPWEGVVWHHPDGRMAKLKRRDVPGAS
jgi:hypothetical protein